MPKAKKGTKENPVTQEDLAAIAEGPKRPYKIIQAVIKDDFCNYTYEMIEGKGPYDKHKVEGKGLIKDDMRDVFNKFRVHMAAIYGIFKLQGIEITDIDQHYQDDITHEFHVDGFKIVGSEDNESIILTGSKYIAELGSRMGIETPKIEITSLSGYKWYNELKALGDKAREEVALYKEGKYTVIETEEEDDADDKPKRKAKQLTIASPEAAAESLENCSDDELMDADFEDDFENAKM